IQHYAGSDAATRDAIRPILLYGHALNMGFALVFMASIATAVLMWSIAILRTRALSRWIAILGSVGGAAALGLVFGGVLSNDLRTFSLFVFGYSLWAVAIGVDLRREPAQVNHA